MHLVLISKYILVSLNKFYNFLLVISRILSFWWGLPERHFEQHLTASLEIDQNVNKCPVCTKKTRNPWNLDDQREIELRMTAVSINGHDRRPSSESSSWKMYHLWLIILWKQIRLKVRLMWMTNRFLVLYEYVNMWKRQSVIWLSPHLNLFQSTKKAICQNGYLC